MMTIKYCFRRILILALVSNKDLVKVIPPISLVIMGALGSLILIGREFIIIEPIILLNRILLRLLLGVHMPLRNFS